jgi:uncharacterized protein (DUF1015 family)
VGVRPFTFAPFRGLRFDPDVVGGLGTVISPPYDVLDADTVHDLEAANRHNIVRLILSRHFERPYLAVRDRLQSWRKRGYLRPDDEPGLYLYEYRVDQMTVRGLIGLVALREEHERLILPHEDVMPGPVDDRAVLMRTTQTNLEPILLVHEGWTDRLRTLLKEAAADPPAADFVSMDRSEHRLWEITDPDVITEITDELAPTRALIADGHHRYAAYLRLQRELRDPAAPEGASPWDYGLAMLVDQREHALRVGPIHRSVAALTMADVQDMSFARGDDFSRISDRERALAALSEVAADGTYTGFVLADGRTWALLRTPRTHPIDAAVLHEDLLPAWRIAEEQVDYHHSLDQALHTITRQPGVVVGVHPPSLTQVMDTAARGVRMPHKSTSFAPKPRMGVVMRDLQDG